jgi:hypothetical protein
MERQKYWFSLKLKYLFSKNHKNANSTVLESSKCYLAVELGLAC